MSNHKGGSEVVNGLDADLRANYPLQSTRRDYIPSKL